MDNFEAVYKILTELEKTMDFAEYDPEESITPKKLKVSDERFARYIEMMQDVGYIKGADMYIDTAGYTHVEYSDMRITLKGLEYLQENSIMRKIYKIAKGIKETVPGL